MAPAEALLLGLDIGTSRIKALLIDRVGRQVGLSVGATPFARQTHGVEMTVAQLDQAVASVLDGLGDRRRHVAAVGIAGIAESGAPLKHNGDALGPIIAWHDPRGAEVVARLTDRFGEELAGWIGQPVRTVSSVAKLGWLIDHGLSGVSCWLGVPELCLRRLTGAWVTEYSLAARTGCYHVGSMRYLPEVAKFIGADPEVFPPVEPAGRIMGRVSSPGAAWSGLPAGAVVTLAGHDHPVGMVGSGAGPHDVVNSIGTAETLLSGVAQLPDADAARSRRIAITVMPGGQRWIVLASGARAGIMLAAAARALGRSTAELDELACHAPSVDAAPLLARIERGDPIVMPRGDPGAVWNGMHAALAARTWDAVERVEALVGPIPRLVMFGGGSQSQPGRQARARLGRLPLWHSTAKEAVAQGAALFAGVAAGWWPSTDAGPQVTLEPV